MTTLASIFQTKLVSQMMIKTDQSKLENFTFLMMQFSFLTLKCPTPMSELKEDEVKKTLFDHCSNENDCFKKHKDHFTIS